MSASFEIFCECCNKTLKKSYYNKHKTTKTHLKNEAIFHKDKINNYVNDDKQENIITDAVLLPTDILDIIFDYKTELENIELNRYFDMIKYVIVNKSGTLNNHNYPSFDMQRLVFRAADKKMRTLYFKKEYNKEQVYDFLNKKLQSLEQKHYQEIFISKNSKNNIVCGIEINPARGFMILNLV